MGYNTRYNLSIVGGDATITGICASCGAHDITKDIISLLKEKFGEIRAEDPINWYNHEKYILSISKEYPTTTFRLSGQGEEPQDKWIKFFKDGIMVVRKALIQIDDSISDDDFLDKE